MEAVLDALFSVRLFFEQIYIIVWKCWRQKLLERRTTIKDCILIPLFVAFLGLILMAFAFANSSGGISPSVYDKMTLPPFSQTDGGVFDPTAKFNQNSNGPVGSRTILYSPKNHSGVNTLMKGLHKLYPDLTVEGYDDVRDAYSTRIQPTFYGVEFMLTREQYATNEFITSSVSTNNVAYTIRMATNGQIRWQDPTMLTYYNDYNVYNDYECAADMWIGTGYMTLQNYIQTRIARQVNITGVAEVDSDFSVDPFFQRYPKSKIYDDKFIVDHSTLRFYFCKWLIPTFLTICIVTPMLGLLVTTVKEREMRMFALLEISGLMPLSLVLGYLIAIYITVCFASNIPVILFKLVDAITPYTQDYYFLLVLFYSLALISQSYFFGFLIPRNEYFGLPVFIVNLGLSIGGLFVANSKEIDVTSKGFLTFLTPTMGLCIGTWSVESLSFHHPDQTLDLTYVDESKGLPSPNNVLGILVVSTIFWAFMSWAMPFDFLYYLMMRLIDGVSGHDLSGIANDAQQRYIQPANGADDKFSNQTSLSVKNVSHVYPDGTKAVKDISFQVRVGEILSFLGSNGAGKSTTMGMLVGSLAVSAGEVLINGINIETSRTKARRSLGICYQQDILFEDLSVEENLYLFAMIRGVHGFALDESVIQMINDLGFPEKSKSLAGTLSGGQKRRLCAGIAMIGGNSVVLLDEPTAGLDPVSRRQLWQLIQKNRKSKAILLTTHFMDEADILGDRISIMKDGIMHAMGTSTFLKNQFGVGYIIKFSTAVELSASRLTPLVSAVKRFISEASLISAAGTEVILRLPKTAASQFPSMLKHIEENMMELRVSSFGIETTKLEEVFMKIIDTDMSSGAAAGSAGSNSSAESISPVAAAAGNSNDGAADKLALDTLLVKGRYDYELGFCERFALMLSPFKTFRDIYVLVKKRFYQFVRSKGQFFMGLIVPILMVILIATLQGDMPSGLFFSEPPIVKISDSFSQAAVSDIKQVIFPESGPSKASVDAYNSEASFTSPTTCANCSFVYVGSTYDQVFSVVQSSAKASGAFNASTNAISYTNQTNNYGVLYNASYPYNFMGAAVNLLAGAIKNVTAGRLTFTEYFQALPQNKLNQQLNDAGFSIMALGLFSGAIGSGLSIVVGGERVNGVKHLQISSGAGKLSYWVANFAWDFFISFLNVFILIIALSIVEPNYFGGSGFGKMMLAGIFYSLASISRFHLFSFFIADLKLAQSIYFYKTLFVSFFLVDIYYNIILNPANGPVNPVGPSSRAVNAIFSVIEPSFGFGMIINFQHNFLSVIDQNGGQSSLVLGSGILEALIFLFIGQVVILYFIEFNVVNCFSCCCIKSYSIVRAPIKKTNEDDVIEYKTKIVSNEDVELGMTGGGGGAAGANSVNRLSLFYSSISHKDDIDVTREKQKVDKLLPKSVAERMSSKPINVTEHTIMDYKISKTFFGKGSVPTKIAVDDVSLSIPCGEIFGLLGANGAGKSTLIKIMSGLEDPSSGMCLVNGFDIVRERSSAQRSMGLCPQFDTLIERLTVRENIEFFAKIKGISSEQVSIVSDAYLGALDIRKYEHKLIMQLSGGNRRKVSLACALIGCPPTVYLDEPSTGLDPVASRYMWRLLNKVSSAKRNAIVLTTHNMAECEAVCSRIAIMKQGEFCCLGNSQHLRTTHGTGYMLEVVVASSDFLKVATNFIFTTFPGSVVIEEHVGMINFEIPKAAFVRLSDAFSTLETNKASIGIIDYSLSQSSLEQVFLKKIRPAEADGVLIDEDNKISKLADPNSNDYFFGYLSLLLAIFIPGFHQFQLGNTCRGWKYLFTFNEMYIGWFLDLFEMHIFIKQSVQERGHLQCCCLFRAIGYVFLAAFNAITLCRCWLCRQCGCCKFCAPPQKQNTNPPLIASDSSSNSSSNSSAVTTSPQSMQPRSINSDSTTSLTAGRESSTVYNL